MSVNAIFIDARADRHFGLATGAVAIRPSAHVTKIDIASQVVDDCVSRFDLDVLAEAKPLKLPAASECTRQLASQTRDERLHGAEPQSNGRRAGRPGHALVIIVAAELLLLPGRIFVEMPPDGSGAFSVWREREAATAVVKQLGAAANAV